MQGVVGTAGLTEGWKEGAVMCFVEERAAMCLGEAGPDADHPCALCVVLMYLRAQEFIKRGVTSAGSCSLVANAALGARRTDVSAESVLMDARLVRLSGVSILLVLCFQAKGRPWPALRGMHWSAHNPV